VQLENNQTTAPEETGVTMSEYLIIILLWCGDPYGRDFNGPSTRAVMQCRKEAIQCASNLEKIISENVIAKCL
jgi:hypothetical protein